MKRFEALIFVAALAGMAGCNSSNVVTVPPPNGAGSGKISHVVVMVQENRSFDNIFAGFPGANTVMEGACSPAPDCKGSSHTIKLHSVKLEAGIGPNEGKDIDHSHNGWEIECDATASNVCRMDGFILIRFGESGGGLKA